MSIDSDFDRTLDIEQDPQKRRDAQLAILLAHVRMTNDQLAEQTVRARDFNNRISLIEKSLSANMTITTEVRDMLDTGKALFKLAGWVATGARWITAVAAAAAVVWGALNLPHSGPKP